MGIGPAVAIPMALERAGVTRESVDVYEINEAFASQAVYCVRKLGLDPAKINPNGGAIALGHPLGCTGARQVRIFTTARFGWPGRVGGAPEVPMAPCALPSCSHALCSGCSPWHRRSPPSCMN